MISKFSVLSVNSSTNNLRLSVYDATPFDKDATKMPLLTENDIYPPIAFDNTAVQALVNVHGHLYLKRKYSGYTNYYLLDDSSGMGTGNSILVTSLDDAAYTASVIGINKTSGGAYGPYAIIGSISGTLEVFTSNSGADFQFASGYPTTDINSGNGDSISNNTSSLAAIPYSASFYTYPLQELYKYSTPGYSYRSSGTWASYNDPNTEYLEFAPTANTYNVPRGFCSYVDLEGNERSLYWEQIYNPVSIWTAPLGSIDSTNPLIYANKIHMAYGLPFQYSGYPGTGQCGSAGQINHYNYNAILWEHIPVTLSQIIPASDVLTQPLAILAYNIAGPDYRWENKVSVSETLA